MGTLLAIGNIANAVTNILKLLARLKPVPALLARRFKALWGKLRA